MLTKFLDGLLLSQDELPPWPSHGRQLDREEDSAGKARQSTSRDGRRAPMNRESSARQQGAEGAIPMNIIE